MPLRTNSGRTSAALPSRAIDSGSPFFMAAPARRKASSRLSVMVSTYFVSRRLSILCGSHSTTMATPSFMVTARGWAPPMPPSPAVRVSVPLSEPPKCFRATADSVS